MMVCMAPEGVRSLLDFASQARCGRNPRLSLAKVRQEKQPVVRPASPSSKHEFFCLRDDGTQPQIKGLGDTKQCVDGGKPLALFDPHDHRPTEAGTRRDLIYGELLPKTLLFDKAGEPVNDGFAIRFSLHRSVYVKRGLTADVPIRQHRFMFLPSLEDSIRQQVTPWLLGKSPL